MMYTIPHDKANHFIAGVLLFALGLLLHPTIGLALAVGYGAGKEVYDKYSGKGTPDVWDFVWTVGGGLIGYAIYWEAICR